MSRMSRVTFIVETSKLGTIVAALAGEVDDLSIQPCSEAEAPPRSRQRRSSPARIGDLPRTQALVLRALQEAGPRGLTREEASDVLRKSEYSPTGLSPVASKLQKLGLVTTGKTDGIFRYYATGA